jgi:hypothetical protein
MILKELISKYNQETILARLIELYPEQEESSKGYRKVLKELSSLEIKSSEMKLNVYKYFDEDDKRYYTNVDGIDKNNNVWAIEFTDWNEWLGMKINIKSLQEYSLLDIVCHALWEMTFCGYSQKKIKEERNELKRRIDSIKKEDLEKED